MTVWVRLPDGNLMTRKEHNAMLQKEKEQKQSEVQPVQATPVVAVAKQKPEPKVTVLETKDDDKKV